MRKSPITGLKKLPWPETPPTDHTMNEIAHYLERSHKLPERKTKSRLPQRIRNQRVLDLISNNHDAKKIKKCLQFWRKIISKLEVYADHQSVGRWHIFIYGGSQKLKFPCIISPKTNKDMLQLIERINQEEDYQEPRKPGISPRQSDADLQEDG